MDLFKLYAQVVQMVMKVLVFVVAAAVYLTGRLVLPVIRSAVVALVRFPAVVADRHYEPQRAEVEWLLAEQRRATTAEAKAPVPVAQLVRATTATPTNESDSIAEPAPDGHVEATEQHPPLPTPAPVEALKSDAEPTPEPDVEGSAEVDEGPVLRYRPKPAPGD